MKFSQVYLFSIILFGIILLYSYYRLLNNSNSIEIFWGQIKGRLRTFYMISLFIIIIAFILTLFYLMFYSNLSEVENSKIFMALFGITIFSLFWLPLSMLYVEFNKNKNNNKNFIQFLIILTLFLVAFSAYYFVIIFKNIKDNSLYKKIVLFGMSYLFFHVFFLDFIFWDYFFFQ